MNVPFAIKSKCLLLLSHWVGLFIWLTANVLAGFENQSICFRRFSTTEGLSHNEVLCILQDHKGFMWFGTYDGLNRFDGYTFKVYRNEQRNSNSLSGNVVYDLYEDRYQRLWIVTQQGIDWYDWNREQFIHIPDASGNLVGGRRIIETPEGEILIAGFQQLYRFNATDSTCLPLLTHLPPSSPFLYDEIRDILRDQFNQIWIAFWKSGLYQMNLTQPQLSPVPLERPELADKNDSHFTYSMTQTSDGFIWLCTSQGLVRINPLNGEQKRFQNTQTRNCLSDNFCWTFFEDHKQHLWIGTDRGGLNFYDRKRNVFIHFQHDPNLPYTLSHNSVKAISEDRQGNLWVGTTNGISVAPTRMNSFQYYCYNSGIPHSLSKNMVTAFAVDQKGNLWIGTDGGGLNLLYLKTNQFRNFSHGPEDKTTLRSNSVLTICCDAAEKIWVGGFMTGLRLYRPGENRFQHFLHAPTDSNSLSHNDVRDILTDSEGNLWIATNGGGLNRLVAATEGRFQHFQADPSQPDRSLVNNHCIRLSEDSQENLWIGTYGGLSRYNPIKNQFTNFIARSKDTTGLSNNWIYDIFEDSQHRMWFGTAKGLNLLLPGSQHFRTYGTETGFINDVINAILEDEHGFLWLSTNQGLVKFHPDKHTVTNFTLQDGLPTEEFNIGAAHQLPSGELVFGSRNGFIRFHPDSVKNVSPQFSVIISDLKLYNHSVTVASENTPLERHISETGELILSNKQAKMFGFEFTAFEFLHPTRVRYRYLLEGYQDNWIEAGSSRTAVFTNIPAGTYVFKVIAGTSNGIWREDGPTIKITILPPFWKTWYACFIYAIILGLLLWFFYRYSMNLQHLKADVQKERLENEKPHEPELLKPELFANNSHEYRTSLTSENEIFIQRAIGIIEEHLSDASFPIESFAAEMGISRALLYQKLKDITGDTPAVFIQKIRLKRAADLLTHSDLSVSEICYEVGFNYPSHFAQLFRSRFGTSPKEYKKRGYPGLYQT